MYPVGLGAPRRHPLIQFPYQAFWCEENVWQLAQRPETAGDERLVLVLTGAAGAMACWQQKAGLDGDPIAWDYHVVLATRDAGWRIWDLDCRVGCPLPASAWLSSTFPFPEVVPAALQPRFALFPASDYIERFSSDRSHMRDPDGRWLQPPPSWPPISGQPSAMPLKLTDAIAQARHGLDLASVTARLR